MRKLLLALGVLRVTAPLWAQVSVTVNWNNPTEHEDGTVLLPTAIRETRLFFATVPSASSPGVVEIVPGAANTFASLPVFSEGTWYVRAQTFEVSGLSSDYSNEDSFIVGRCQANPSGCRPRPPTGLTVQIQ